MVDFSKRRLFTRQLVDSDAIRLPWIISAEVLTDLCTRCGQCLTACEMNIIVHGDGGFPSVDFALDECTFCYQCAEVCPAPIFLPQSESPWQATASISQRCLATQNVECRSCGDSCDVMAIHFHLAAGKVAQPVINTDECNGCGACVSVCPTDAIKVTRIE
ncbi:MULTISPECIES: ferredoxin-type protein NapF [Vibrio]|uniref:Ferredoxin-type protein NapF n=1 Tax=Vibrio ostreae TaxID=2841925 RepID=A0A975U6Z0_9VIBR|nr:MULTISPECIES: ferredoxin-type protein NapF [Vibrio]QXO16348.1 ferredoxin-type protein NapF [Vibrio ostreae]